MILGIGFDLCETGRLQRAMARTAFARRVFSPAEIAFCERRRDRLLCYAARFAAKEAYFKAIGTGWGRGVKWLDVEVASDGHGPPRLLVSGEARRVARALGVEAAHLSLTHSGDYAAAMVVVEGPRRRRVQARRLTHLPPSEAGRGTARTGGPAERERNRMRRAGHSAIISMTAGRKSG